MASYESPKLVANKPHLNLPDQKTMDLIAHKIKVREKLLLERKKELERAKNWDFKKEVAKRMEEHRRLQALDPAIRKRSLMSKEEMCERVRLSLCEGKLTVDRSVFRQDIDRHSGSLGKFKICVGGSCTPHYADDAYGSVTDKLMKTDFLKADKSSSDDPDEFVKGPQDTVEKDKKSM